MTTSIYSQPGPIVLIKAFIDKMCQTGTITLIVFITVARVQVYEIVKANELMKSVLLTQQEALKC